MRDSYLATDVLVEESDHRFESFQSQPCTRLLLRDLESSFDRHSFFFGVGKLELDESLGITVS